VLDKREEFLTFIGVEKQDNFKEMIFAKAGRDDCKKRFYRGFYDSGICDRRRLK